MSTTNPDVDQFLKNSKQWQTELKQLRKLLLSTKLAEDFKWRAPCYTFEGSNVVILGRFKQFCSLSFFKGVLLKDPQGVLVAPGENSQSVRMFRFTNIGEIFDQEATIKAYIDEAIAIEKSGQKVESTASSNLELPEELQQMLSERPDLEEAFQSLTPGRQRAYVIHISGAKQSKTRTARIEKCIPRILSGKGLNDCVCGHSKKMPGCDGSHAKLNK
ncbi:hypothetical protein GC197_05235 [bacterium]|nr:hypothetical protein [bacterium]